MVRLAALAPLLALACAPADDTATALLAADAAPPPFQPVLEISPIVLGQPVLFRVSDVPVGAQVYVFYSKTGPGAGPCLPTTPVCVDLSWPVSQLVNRLATPPGVVQFSPVAPLTLAVQPYWFQAIVVDGTDVVKTEILVRVVGDADNDWIIDPNDNCPTIYNPRQTDDDADGFGAGCDCDDFDITAYPGAPGDTTVDGVDQDCDGVDGNGASPPVGDWDGTYDGAFTMVFNVFGTQVPCIGSGIVTVDESATPQIDGGSSCIVPGFPLGFSIEGAFDPVSGVALGQVNDGSAPVTWNGAFFQDGADDVLEGTFSGGVPAIGTYTGAFRFVRQ